MKIHHSKIFTRRRTKRTLWANELPRGLRSEQHQVPMVIHLSTWQRQNPSASEHRAEINTTGGHSGPRLDELEESLDFCSSRLQRGATKLFDGYYRFTSSTSTFFFKAMFYLFIWLYQILVVALRIFHLPWSTRIFFFLSCGMGTLVLASATHMTRKFMKCSTFGGLP